MSALNKELELRFAKAFAAIRLFLVMFVLAIAFMTLADSRGNINLVRFLLPAYLCAVMLISSHLQINPENKRRYATTMLSLAGAVIVSVQFLKANHYLLGGNQYSAWLNDPVSRLKKRGLTNGHADYWAEHLLRVASAEELELIPIDVSREGKLQPIHWFADAVCFRNASGNFAVFAGEVPRPTPARRTPKRQN
jgi:hypothetical protein